MDRQTAPTGRAADPNLADPDLEEIPDLGDYAPVAPEPDDPHL